MTTLYHLQMIGLFEAKSPIIHTEETIGNVARIKRIKVLDAGAPVLVPALSGNSFRGQLRDLIGDHFIEMVRENDNPVTMSPLMYGVIFSGGVLKEKYKEAHELYKSGNIQDAKKMFVSLTLKKPLTWQLWFSLATIYQFENNLNQAIIAYSQASILNKKNAFIYYHLAECMLSLNDKKKAITFLDLANKVCHDEDLKDKIEILKKQNIKFLK